MCIKTASVAATGGPSTNLPAQTPLPATRGVHSGREPRLAAVHARNVDAAGGSNSSNEGSTSGVKHS